MAGHGSPPAVDKANHPGRQVGREPTVVVESPPRRTPEWQIGTQRMGPRQPWKRRLKELG
jgi:hypothetical protein